MKSVRRPQGLRFIVFNKAYRAPMESVRPQGLRFNVGISGWLLKIVVSFVCGTVERNNIIM